MADSTPLIRNILKPFRLICKMMRNLAIAILKFLASVVWEMMTLLMFGRRLWIRIKWPPEYYRSEHWKKVRSQAFEYYGRKCAICGTTQRLQVHHLIYKRNGRSVLGREDIQKDLVVLCKKHHPKGYYSLRTIKRDRAAYKWYGGMLK